MIEQSEIPLYQKPGVVIHDEENGSHIIYFLGGMADLDYSITSTDLEILGTAPLSKFGDSLYAINESLWYEAHANRCFSQVDLRKIFVEARQERVRRLETAQFINLQNE